MPPFQERENGILTSKLEKAHQVTEATGSAVTKRAAPKNLQQVTSQSQTVNVGGSNSYASKNNNNNSNDNASSSSSVVTNDSFFPPFYCSNNGILYENKVLEIGVKTEFNKNICKSLCVCVCMCVCVYLCVCETERVCVCVCV